MRLTQKQITLIAGALHIAAEQYVNDMATALAADQQRLRDQFEQQLRMSEELAEIFECADSVDVQS